jgi:hypothetical protein
MERLRTIYIGTSTARGAEGISRGKEKLRIGFAGEVEGVNSVAIKVIEKGSLAHRWHKLTELFVRRWAPINLEAPKTMVDLDGKLVFINIRSVEKRLAGFDVSQSDAATLSADLMKQHRDYWAKTEARGLHAPLSPSPRMKQAGQDRETLDQYIAVLVTAKRLDGPALERMARTGPSIGQTKILDLMRPSSDHS